MQCPNCGSLSPHGSKYCFECGQRLEDGEFAFEAAPGRQTGHVANTGAPGEPILQLPERSWPMVLLLGLLTCGIYFYWWFLARFELLNRVRSSKRLNPGLLWAALLMSASSLLLSGVTGGLEGAGQAGVAADLAPLAHLADLLSFISTLLGWHQALTLRRMLKQHAVARTGRKLDAGWLWTILFGPLHLQSVVNRLRSRM